MDEFTHIFQNIKIYLDQFPIEENPLQQKMRKQAQTDQKEHWLIPTEVGKLFYFLTKISDAKRIYEIGSYLGYSATWFADGLSDNGKVILTEQDKHRHQQAQNIFRDSAYFSKVDFRHCNAHEDLENEKELFDIILIDHDKPDYCKAYNIAKKKVKKGGFIIADNVLWRGRIVNPKFTEEDTDKGSTSGVMDFNKLIMNDPDVTSLIIPIGDGVSISILK